MEHEALVKCESTAMQNAVAFAQSFLVDGESRYTEALDVVKEAKRRSKLLKERWDKYAEPAHELLRRLKEDFAPPLDLAREVERVLKSKCVAFRSQVDAQQRAAVAAAQEALAAHAPAVELRAALATIDAANAPKVDGVSFRTTWDVEVFDPGAVPPHYLCVNIPAIERDVRAAKGQLDIPGVLVHERVITSVRA